MLDITNNKKKDKTYNKNLTVIFNELSNASVATTASDGGEAVYAWLGGRETDTEGDFAWVDGDTFWSGGESGGSLGLFVNFGDAEPDDFEGRQDSVAMGLTDWPLPNGGNGVAGEWNDLDGSDELASVVEFETVPEPATVYLPAVIALCFFAGRGSRKKGS